MKTTILVLGLLLLYSCCTHKAIAQSSASASVGAGSRLSHTPQKPAQPKKKHKLTDTVGVINGEVVTLSAFRERLSRNLELASHLGVFAHDSVTPTQLTEYVDSTWAEFIDDAILERAIVKRHLALTDTALERMLLESPPEELKRAVSDSLGVYHPETLRQILTDSTTASVADEILAAAESIYERNALIASVAHEPADGPHPKFDAWLKTERKHAKIVDRRTSFGYY